VLFPGPHPDLAVWLKFLEELPVPRELPAAELSRALGAARLRLGQAQEALAPLELAKKDDADGGTSWDWYFLALAYRALDRPADAETALAAGRAWVKRQEQGTLKNARYRSGLTWQEALELEHLEKEATIKP
jgi:hypothetical protein